MEVEQGEATPPPVLPGEVTAMTPATGERTKGKINSNLL